MALWSSSCSSGTSSVARAGPPSPGRRNPPSSPAHNRRPSRATRLPRKAGTPREWSLRCKGPRGSLARRRLRRHGCGRRLRFCASGDDAPNRNGSDGEKNDADDAPIEAPEEGPQCGWLKDRDRIRELLLDRAAGGWLRFRRFSAHDRCFFWLFVDGAASGNSTRKRLPWPGRLLASTRP